MFDNEHCHDYQQWHLVGVGSGGYDGMNYGYTDIKGGPEKVFPSALTVADLVLATDMVVSRSHLKRLLKAGAVKVEEWGRPVALNVSMPLPIRESIYTIVIGHRHLEVVYELTPIADR